MQCLARLDAPGVLHHFMGRGTEKRKIFTNKKDRNDFISRLAELAEGDAMGIYAWASMLYSAIFVGPACLCVTARRQITLGGGRALTSRSTLRLSIGHKPRCLRIFQHHEVEFGLTHKANFPYTTQEQNTLAIKSEKSVVLSQMKLAAFPFYPFSGEARSLVYCSPLCCLPN